MPKAAPIEFTDLSVSDVESPEALEIIDRSVRLTDEDLEVLRIIQPEPYPRGVYAPALQDARLPDPPDDVERQEGIELMDRELNPQETSLWQELVREDR